MLNKEENINTLIEQGLNPKEILTLVQSYPQSFAKKGYLEEVIVLLGSLQIIIIKDFITTYPYLLDYDFYELAKIIGEEVRRTKDYHIALNKLDSVNFYYEKLAKT